MQNLGLYAAHDSFLLVGNAAFYRKCNLCSCWPVGGKFCIIYLPHGGQFSGGSPIGKTGDEGWLGLRKAEIQSRNESLFGSSTGREELLRVFIACASSPVVLLAAEEESMDMASAEYVEVDRVGSVGAKVSASTIMLSVSSLTISF